MAANLAPGITGKWVLNKTNFPSSDLRAMKSHLTRGFPTIVGNRDSTALISDGGLPHQKTTKSGTELPTKALGRDNSEWPQRLLVGGKVYISRTTSPHPLRATATRYCPIFDGGHWMAHLMQPFPEVDSDTMDSPIPVSHHVPAGATVGGDRWIRTVWRNKSLD